MSLWLTGVILFFLAATPLIGGVAATEKENFSGKAEPFRTSKRQSREKDIPNEFASGITWRRFGSLLRDGLFSQETSKAAQVAALQRLPH